MRFRDKRQVEEISEQCESLSFHLLLTEQTALFSIVNTKYLELKIRGKVKFKCTCTYE